MKKVNRGDRTGLEEASFELVVRAGSQRRQQLSRDLSQKAPARDNPRRAPPGQRDQCEGSEVGMDLEHLRNSKRASVAGMQ